MRLLAGQTGLRVGLSAAMARRGFDPVYDLGEVLLLDLAEAQILGGEAISDFQGLRHLGPVIGPVPSTPTVWRALSEVGELQLGRVNAAVTEFRRHWWVLLTQHPEGFPWLKVAGRELCGVTVVELDASIVFASSEKENVQPTYKGGVGFCGEPGHLRHVSGDFSMATDSATADRPGEVPIRRSSPTPGSLGRQTVQSNDIAAPLSPRPRRLVFFVKCYAVRS